MTGKWRKRLLYAGAGVALLGMLAAFGVWFLARLLFEYGSNVVSEIPSPDGRYRAVLWETDGGATTIGSTEVSILKKNRSLTIWASDKICFSQEATAKFTKVEVQWSSPTELTISYDVSPSLEAEFPRTVVDGITVSYRVRKTES